MTKALQVLGALAAAALICGATSAQSAPVAGSTLELAREIALTATNAERAASTPSVQTAVTAAVQDAIILSAASPTEVLTAIDAVFVACRPTDGRTLSWTCPASPQAYAALTGLRNLVVAQLDQAEPAAIGTRGYAAFGSIQSDSPGGSGYRTP